jgi:hypothetical protein
MQHEAKDTVLQLTAFLLSRATWQQLYVPVNVLLDTEVRHTVRYFQCHLQNLLNRRINLLVRWLHYPAGPEKMTLHAQSNKKDITWTRSFRTVRVPN